MILIIFFLPTLLAGALLLGMLRFSRRTYALCLAAMVAGLFVRYACYSYVSDDYTTFLSKWVEHLSANGGFKALSEPIGDYNLPYLYFLAAVSYVPDYAFTLIKSFSMVFDTVLAFAALKLVSTATANQNRGITAFFITFFLPTVFLNSACWAQCDSIYAAFALLGLYFALAEKPNLAVAMMAIAFSFKMQTIFILPMAAPLLAVKKLKFKNLLVFIPVFLAMMLPALFLGLPVTKLLSAYFEQAGEYSTHLTLNAPNLYMLIKDQSDYNKLFYIGLAAAAAFLGIILIVGILKSERLKNKQLILLAFIICLALPWLLPRMHERYFYLADALAIVLACCDGNYIFAPVLAQTASFSGYYAYLKLRYLFPMKAGAVIFLMALAATLLMLFFELKRHPARDIQGRHDL